MVTTQYSNLGVTFTDGYDQIHISPTAFPNDSAGLSNYISNIVLAFAQPMNAIAVDYPGAVQFKLFWHGELFYTSSMFWVQWPSGIGGFGGLTSTQVFDEVVILDPSGDVSIDDLHFGPPIPAPGALALLGAAALLGTTSRRRRA